jgi:hypothetical protein
MLLLHADVCKPDSMMYSYPLLGQVFDEAHFTGEKNENFVIAVAFLRSSHKLNRVTKFTDFWYVSLARTALYFTRSSFS